MSFFAFENCQNHKNRVLVRKFKSSELSPTKTVTIITGRPSSNIQTIFQVYKPLTYIRKMRGIARKLTTDCDQSHRVEIASMFKNLWASIKSCGSNDTNFLIAGERNLMLNTDKNVFNLDTTIADRSKAFCHITGYYKRNEITFGSKIKGVVDPERALQLFSG